MKFAKKSDIVILVGVLAVAGLLWLFYQNTLGAQPPKAEIYYGSQLVETVELSTGEDRIFSIPQNPHVVFHLTPEGTLGFVESDCPDQVCVRAGMLDRAGETAACLPNQIILKIVPTGEQSTGDMDLIVG